MWPVLLLCATTLCVLGLLALIYRGESADDEEPSIDPDDPPLWMKKPKDR